MFFVYINNTYLDIPVVENVTCFSVVGGDVDDVVKNCVKNGDENSKDNCSSKRISI